MASKDKEGEGAVHCAKKTTGVCAITKRWEFCGLPRSAYEYKKELKPCLTVDLIKCVSQGIFRCVIIRKNKDM